jgi:uncharacterized membrane protein YhaH (DUF805 family)
VRFAVVLVAFFGPIVATQIVFGGSPPSDVRATVGCWMVPVMLACVVCRLMQDVKRLHDMGRSGFWAFCAIVPGVSLIYMVVLAVAEGQPFTNEYGPDPAGRGTDIESITDVFR